MVYTTALPVLFPHRLYTHFLVPCSCYLTCCLSLTYLPVVPHLDCLSTFQTKSLFMCLLHLPIEISQRTDLLSCTHPPAPAEYTVTSYANLQHLPEMFSTTHRPLHCTYSRAQSQCLSRIQEIHIPYYVCLYLHLL